MDLFQSGWPRVSATLLIAAFACRAQSPRAAPRYEVSSIKPNAGSGVGFSFHFEPDGSLSATGITLKRLMMTAYNVQGFRIVGAPEWIGAKQWDIQAKPNRAASSGEIRPMLRALLEDRFHLRTHSEVRQVPAYELTISRNGPKLSRPNANETETQIETGAGLLHMTKVTAGTFASQLSYSVARQVIDKTGLSGEYDFRLAWTPEPGEDGGPGTSGLPPGIPRPDPATPERPSIFTAITQQLGLKLGTTKSPVEVVVIDDAEMPEAN